MAFFVTVVIAAVLLRCLAAPKPHAPSEERAESAHHLRGSEKRDRAPAVGDVEPRPGTRPARFTPSSTQSTGGGIASSVHVALGVPTDADASDDYLMDERAFVLSYNPKRRVPNWVAWELSDAGPRARRRG